jgi:hypothetical protein
MEILYEDRNIKILRLISKYFSPTTGRNNFFKEIGEPWAIWRNFENLEF